MSRPRIALTLGDPAGIGGELAAKLLAATEPSSIADILVIASRRELDRAAAHACVTLDVPDDSDTGESDSDESGSDESTRMPTLVDPGRSTALPTNVGVVSAEGGAWALDALRFALGLAADGRVDAICFTPLNKTSLHLAGMTENDELRWFANQLGYDGATSELNVLGDLWTARVTSHIALADVAARITADAVAGTVMMLHQVLRDAGVAAPRIGVAALNPHAGESGSFGRQEIDEIGPGIERARAAGADATGPFPSDTIFLRARAGQFDGVVTMYHDQGQIAMKMMGFDQGVTVQGGLPVAITTPAHGSAFDIAGENRADLGATLNAFRLAVTIASRQRARTQTSRTQTSRAQTARETVPTSH